MSPLPHNGSSKSVQGPMEIRRFLAADSCMRWRRILIPHGAMPHISSGAEGLPPMPLRSSSRGAPWHGCLGNPSSVGTSLARGWMSLYITRVLCAGQVFGGY